jgi:uncharacterized membrane protein (DUF2068 family)
LTSSRHNDLKPDQSGRAEKQDASASGAGAALDKRGAAMDNPSSKRAPTLYGIVVFKISKGLLLLSLALGVYSLAGEDLREQFEAMVRWVKLDAESQFFSRLGDWIEQISAQHLRWVAAGTFVYSLFSLVEGVGLAFRLSWAGWLAIGESAFFIPIEIYDLSRHFTITVALILMLNIIIFWYLLQNRKRIFRHHLPSEASR